MDTLAEWSRRRLAKPMGFPRVGSNFSNPTGVDLFQVSFSQNTPSHPQTQVCCLMWQKGLVDEYIIAIDVTRVRFPEGGF
eukprot:1566983-Amphidinium_carterae.1